MAKRTRSAIGRQNRAKGAQWEREVANLLKPIYPTAERNIAQSRTAKREGCDVEGTPWWLELTCGRVTEKVVLSKWSQAHRDKDHRPVVLVVKPTRQEPFVVMEGTTAGAVDLSTAAVRFHFRTWLVVLAARQRAVVTRDRMCRPFISPDPTEPFEVRS